MQSTSHLTAGSTNKHNALPSKAMPATQCSTRQREAKQSKAMQINIQINTVHHCIALQSEPLHVRNAKHCNTMQSKAMHSHAPQCNAMQTLAQQCKATQRHTLGCISKTCNAVRSGADPVGAHCTAQQCRQRIEARGKAKQGHAMQRNAKPRKANTGMTRHARRGI